MAMDGYHKGLRSSNKKLEVKRAGKDWMCCGAVFERGERRPDHVKDMMVVVHSRRCVGTIKQGQLYLGNDLLPQQFLKMIHGSYKMYIDWPLCVPCGIEFYGEYLSGEQKINQAPPMTEEEIEELRAGLTEMLVELRSTNAA